MPQLSAHFWTAIGSHSLKQKIVRSKTVRKSQRKAFLKTEMKGMGHLMAHKLRAKKKAKSKPTNKPGGDATIKGIKNWAEDKLLRD